MSDLRLDVHKPRGTAPSPTGGGVGAATLLLLHGFSDSGAAWADAVHRWTAAGRRVVAADARGHGSSPRWDASRLARRPGAVMVDDVLDLLADPRVAPVPGAPVVLVGHSMGAAVAVAVAARCVGGHLPGLSAVVAEDPPWPLPPILAPDPVRARAFTQELREDTRGSVAALVARGRTEHPAWPKAELEPWARATHDCDQALAATGDIVPPDPWPELLAGATGSGVRVLVVTGDTDVRVPPASEAEARRRGARVERLAGAGHCVRRDATDAYHGVVDAFLADV